MSNEFSKGIFNQLYLITDTDTGKFSVIREDAATHHVLLEGNLHFPGLASVGTAPATQAASSKTVAASSMADAVASAAPAASGMYLPNYNYLPYWRKIPDIAANHLRDVWASGPADVWAVGDQGTVLHFDGNVWASVDAGVGANDLYGIWGRSSAEIHIVGEKRTQRYFNGGAWSDDGRVDLPGENEIITAVSGDDFMKYSASYAGRIQYNNATPSVNGYWGNWRDTLGIDGGLSYKFNGIAVDQHGLFYAVGYLGNMGTPLMYVGAQGESSYALSDYFLQRDFRSFQGARRVGQDLIVVGDNYANGQPQNLRGRFAILKNSSKYNFDDGANWTTYNALPPP